MQTPVTKKGIWDLLREFGLYSEWKVLNHFPRKYEDYTISEDEGHLIDGQRLTVVGYIEGEFSIAPTRAPLSIITFRVRTPKNSLFLFQAFNHNYLTGLKTGPEHIYTFSGIVNLKRMSINYTKHFLGVLPKEESLQPVYSLPSSIKNGSFWKIVKTALEHYRGKVYNTVPDDLLELHQLMDKSDTIRALHFPKNRAEIQRAIDSLKYEESLLFAIKSIVSKETKRRIRIDDHQEITSVAVNAFFKTLPFTLTAAQKRVSREIYNDLHKPFLMNRFLQGDVGSGKTMVALIALFFNYLQGKQGVLMVPTNAVANQHYQTITKIFAGYPQIKIGLMTGDLKAQARHQLLTGIAQNEYQIIVGTHALFSADVTYKNLGMVVIDEQHKFGTTQRQELISKSQQADILMMSATPIPRTLTLALFGELDLSYLDEHPFGGERDIETRLMHNDLNKIRTLISESLNQEQRVFVVAPAITDQDSMLSIDQVFNELNALFPGKIAFLHGKMKAENQKSVLEKFRNGQCPILVATTIIEVGIDVLNANLMIVYSPTRFGLATLHQLRGRIGRDGKKGYFVLVSNPEDQAVKSQQRLNVIAKTTDGLEIAKSDLKMRGSGEIDGVKQSGGKDYQYLDPLRDAELIKQSRIDAEYLLDHSFERRYNYIIKLALTGFDKNLRNS